MIMERIGAEGGSYYKGRFRVGVLPHVMTASASVSASVGGKQQRVEIEM